MTPPSRWPGTGQESAIWRDVDFGLLLDVSGGRLRVVILALVLKSARGGRYGPGDYWLVEGAVKYWHMVDVAWVFIYPTLYLVR